MVEDGKRAPILVWRIHTGSSLARTFSDNFDLLREMRGSCSSRAHSPVHCRGTMSVLNVVFTMLACSMLLDWPGHETKRLPGGAGYWDPGISKFSFIQISTCCDIWIPPLQQDNCAVDDKVATSTEFVSQIFPYCVLLVLYYARMRCEIQTQKLRNNIPGSTRPGLFRFSKILVQVGVIMIMSSAGYIGEASDLRSSITNGSIECVSYNQNDGVFSLTCDREWTGSNDSISLLAYEVFEGNGHTIDLEGLNEFDGLFAISDTIDTFNEAPIIRNLHTTAGQTSRGAGFIVRKKQKFFVVDSCSSSGVTFGKMRQTVEYPFIDGGGGICGKDCGKDGGQISISNSFSSGTVGEVSGGIVGSHVARNGGTVNITNCHSTGAITGRDSGGICGTVSGYKGGRVCITQSSSTGMIRGNQAGGIIGGEGGYDSGSVFIKECFSTGHIAGERSGGITGDDTTQSGGTIRIIDCYSRGNVEGSNAGGICGYGVGGIEVDDEPWGTVDIRNTYASGNITGTNAGGIMGSISGGTVTVQYSVYDSNGNEMVGDGSNVNGGGNSPDINDILGQLYHVNDTLKWSDRVWATSGPEALPRLRFQLPTPSPTQSPTPSTTSSPTTTRTPSWTPTTSETPTPTGSASGTSSRRYSDARRGTMKILTGYRAARSVKQAPRKKKKKLKRHSPSP